MIMTRSRIKAAQTRLVAANPIDSASLARLVELPKMVDVLAQGNRALPETVADHRRQAAPDESWTARYLRQPRRRYVWLAIAAVVLAVVPGSIAFGSSIANLFQGSPAPSDVRARFEASNRIADALTQQGFASEVPRADVSQARGVLQIDTGDGAEELWAAPNDKGGQCWFVDFANDPAVENGKPGFGGCTPPSPVPVGTILWGAVTVDAHPSLLTVWGHVPEEAATTVTLKLSDGSKTSLPVVSGYFLGSFDSDARVADVSAFDSNGDKLSMSSGQS